MRDQVHLRQAQTCLLLTQALKDGQIDYPQYVTAVSLVNSQAVVQPGTQPVTPGFGMNVVPQPQFHSWNQSPNGVQH